jgi:RNA-binding protein
MTSAQEPTMPAPTNPKKRALMPSSPLRKTLRSAGHHLSAIVQVGKEGVTEPVLRQLDEALRAHELVKVKVGTESPEDRFEVADRFGAGTGAQVAQVLGRTVLVYRRRPEKPRFEPLQAGAQPAPAPEFASPGGRARRGGAGERIPAKRGGARGGAGERGPARRGGARGGAGERGPAKHGGARGGAGWRGPAKGGGAGGRGPAKRRGAGGRPPVKRGNPRGHGPAKPRRR